MAIDAKLTGCRVCGTREGRRFSARGFEWHTCRQCGTVQKVLTPDEFRALDPGYDPGPYLDARTPEQLAAFLGVRKRTRVIAEALSRYGRRDPRGLSFLDVGCGMGGYLLAAKQLGMRVKGFEPSEDHSRVARERLGLPIVMDYFSSEKVPGETFDMVMLSHVIEHIYEPAGFVNDLLSVLNPGGVLLISTPNARGLIARLLGRHWPMLRPIDHVTLISAKAFQCFSLPSNVMVDHRSSEYPYEFGATVASVIRDEMRDKSMVPERDRGRDQCANTGVRQVERRFPLLLSILSAISLPVYALGGLTGSRACLVTALVKNA